MVEQWVSPLGPETDLTDRIFFEAVLYRARTGIPWRDLPGDVGAWVAVYSRFRRWIHSGLLRTIFELMAEWPECEGRDGR
ncbi:transposase [Tundrisphaera lichenicola]|uniref:transposase n=1 Tax=Tundrisphaera lichenicola TaxID=2029860 RepID=UPI003EB8C390